ncbi:helix-turn-helix transcriptional regulator [Klebsiella pneumoniae subsp. pneumoniae]|nr:helix-turn-helix transcriptional regulator [Klebsiella pneumoniae subsp. pneumoniae]
MKNEPLCHAPCPIARSLGRIGDSWSIMILRDAFAGFTRFDEFQKSSNVAPNILSRRLKELVDDGLLEKVCYSSTPAALRIPPHAARPRFPHGAAGAGGMG